jgi:hypothetical protein
MRFAEKAKGLFILLIVTPSISFELENLNETGLNSSLSAENAPILPEPNESLVKFDFAEAERCYHSSREWFDRSRTNIPKWRLCHPSKTLQSSDFEPYTGTSILEIIQTRGAGTVYTACDGIPRFRFSSDAVKTTESSYITAVVEGWRFGNWTSQCSSSSTRKALPQCEVPQGFCDDMWKSYRSQLETYSEPEPFATMSGRPALPCGAEGECLLDLQDEIALIYWPPHVVSRNICATDARGFGQTVFDPPTASSVVTMTEITFHGAAMYRKSWIMDQYTGTWNDPTISPSVMTGLWTLTSPTVYIAHRPITVISMGRHIGTSGIIDLKTSKLTARPSGVFALQSKDIYSLKPHLFKSDPIKEANMIAKGLWRREPGQLNTDIGPKYETMPFDFGHLQDPVPADVYLEAREDCWAKQTHCATITDSSYRPRLLIARHVWRSLLSDQNFCQLPALVDPPIALTRIQGDELPVLVVPHPTPTKRPGSVPNEPLYGQGSAIPAPMPWQGYGVLPRPTAPYQTIDFAPQSAVTNGLQSGQGGSQQNDPDRAGRGAQGYRSGGLQENNPDRAGRGAHGYRNGGLQENQSARQASTGRWTQGSNGLSETQAGNIDADEHLDGQLSSSSIPTATSTPKRLKNEQTRRYSHYGYCWPFVFFIALYVL